MFVGLMRREFLPFELKRRSSFRWKGNSYVGRCFFRRGEDRVRGFFQI